MKLAIVCARNPRKLADTVTPSDTAARDLCSSDHDSKHHEPCSDRSISQTSASTSRDDVWSCGVCYEEVCCPFTLPCGHTVCGSCLQQLLMNQARCPFCRVSVFRGCSFGRNVSMWNSIQARRPKEAAKLANTAAVITYNPSAVVQSQPPPLQPQQEHLTLGVRVLEQLRALGAAQVQSALPSSQTPDPGLATLTSPQQSSGAGQGIFSRLASLGFPARRATDADSAAAQQAQRQSVAVAAALSTPSVTTSPSTEALFTHRRTLLNNSSYGHEHEDGARMVSTGTAAQGVTSHAGEQVIVTHGLGLNLAHARMRQSEVLRRAQAAFADLRQASGRQQEHSAAVRPG